MRFGISTHLFHDQRLDRQHLAAIAEAGFDLVELFATRSHFDYWSPEAVRTAALWLDELSLTPWSLHLPICDGFTGGHWGRAYSNASPDTRVRHEAMDETVAALHAARDLGCRMAVLHLGLPDEQRAPPGDNDPTAARRSLESIGGLCREANVRLAIELIPNRLATAAPLRDWLEGDLDLSPAGACLDIGHAHLTGGAPEAAEVLAGHLVTTHVHDNRGRTDDHLVPFDGTVDWPATLMALSKVGYQGPLIFELPAHDDVARTLARAVDAERRIQAILKDLAEPFAFSED